MTKPENRPAEAPAFDSRAFAARIDALCKKRGITLNQVALELGIAPKKLYGPVKSDRASANSIGQVLQALGLPWAFLDTLADDPKAGGQ